VVHVILCPRGYDLTHLKGDIIVRQINRIAIAVFFVCLSFSIQTRAETWSKLENSHFNMYTTAREKVSRELFMELEGFRTLVVNFIKVEIPPTAEKVSIFVFNNLADFKKYTWRKDIAGFVMPTENSAIIVLPAWVWGMDSTNIIYHEFVHTLLRHHQVKLPGWYQEGLAELFGATKFSDGHFILGAAPKDRFEAMSYGGQLASFDDIVSDKFLTHRSKHNQDPYLQYWMLAHYLEFGNKKRKQDLELYLTLYSNGADSLEAFQMVFGQTPEELWKTELKKYMNQKRIPGFRVDVSPELSDIAITVTEADMREVESAMLPLNLLSASASLNRNDYERGYDLLQKLAANTNPEDVEYIRIINNLVWLLSTCPKDKYRNGEEAVRLGELYIKDKTENISYLDTLASAYAEAGHFDKAVELQASLVDKLDKNDPNKEGFSKRLEKYRNNESWRE